MMERNVEKKYVSINSISVFIGFTLGDILPYTFTFPGLQQGVANNQRIGTRVTLKRIKFKGTLMHNLSLTTSGSKVRLIVVQFKSPRGATTTIDDFLSNPSPFSEAFLSQYKRYDQGATQPYKILVDKRWTLQAQDAGHSITERTTMKVQFTLNWKNGLQVRYNGGGSLEANIFQNNIKMFWISDMTTLGTSPKLDAGYRMFYTDG